MHQQNIQPWQHAHSFGQEQKRLGEQRTVVVVAMTATMMLVEIAAGIVFGSMALLADGLHMTSHAAALGTNLFAYRSPDAMLSMKNSALARVRLMPSVVSRERCCLAFLRS